MGINSQSPSSLHKVPPSTDSSLFKSLRVHQADTSKQIKTRYITVDNQGVGMAHPLPLLLVIDVLQGDAALVVNCEAVV